MTSDHDERGGDVSPTTIVHRSFDAVQTEMLGDVLRDAGIAARVVGTRSGAAIGVGQVIMQLHIAVPRAQAGEAIDLLESFLAGDGADRLREQGALDGDGEPGDDDAAPAETPRRSLFAVGLALIMPLGAGHLYARRPWTALAIFAGQLAAFRISLEDLIGSVAVGLVVVAIALVALDIAGALRAVRAPTAAPPGALRQLANGGAMLVIAAAIGAAASLLPPPAVDADGAAAPAPLDEPAPLPAY